MKMRNLIIAVVLIGFTVGSIAWAAEKTKMGWSNPTTNTDGSSLVGTITNKVYCGASSGTYSKTTLISGLTTTWTTLSSVACVVTGTNYFAVTATVANVESEKSNEANIMAINGRYFDVMPEPNPPSSCCSFF